MTNVVHVRTRFPVHSFNDELMQCSHGRQQSLFATRGVWRTLERVDETDRYICYVDHIIMYFPFAMTPYPLPSSLRLRVRTLLSVLVSRVHRTASEIRMLAVQCYFSLENNSSVNSSSFGLISSQLWKNIGLYSISKFYQGQLQFKFKVMIIIIPASTHWRVDAGFFS